MKLKVMRNLKIALLCLSAAFLLTACGGGNSSGTSHGTLSTALTDSTTDEFQAVYVTITSVEVHHDGDDTWETVATPDKTYNLLDLVNGVSTPLGVSSLATGHYTQMRLIIGNTPEIGINMFGMQHPYANYAIDQTGAVHDMKVPSGSNSGLKIVNGFDINENQTTELLLDFDAMRSVVKAGSSGQYLLKPTIKVLNSAYYASAFGTITDAGNALQSGALVTAQVTAPAALDAKDQVVIDAGTLTDDNGEYALRLEAGDYNLVTSQTGYLPACTAVTLQAGNPIMVDFTLTAPTTPSGNISGTLTIANASADQYATIDFRQTITCVDELTATTISVKSVNIGNGGAYTLDLPAGDYQVVTSTLNGVTQTADVTITSAGAMVLNISI
ncbi:DUF4382 domain-containing protein [Geopsychrobacter electrodiphilus]|uniref:DUF4382 domain-containing protein n=1 Tax=Geopsychrobacter electrodiphilus TaxID=225196 RepID=UPI000368615C|nr:DUF4382 domain-containing protein [Geopsychrobacter electrodiphilus]